VEKFSKYFEKRFKTKPFDGVFIGSEKVAGSGKKAPPKGSLEFIKFIIDQVKAREGNCVMVGDKANTDLLPADWCGISSILVPNHEYICDWPLKVKTLSELPQLVEDLRFGVFISYSHKDKRFVKRMEQALTKEGLKLWRDERDAYIGDDLKRTIIRAIRSNPGFLVVLTNNSVNSNWVRREIRIADKASQHGRKWIFTVLAKKGVKPPGNISHRLYADCSGKNFSQQEFLARNEAGD
jgi:hypothetical protein